MPRPFELESLENRSLLTAAPFSLAAPNVYPEDFRLTTFATGQNFPTGMAQLSDGSLLVAETDPGSVSYFGNSTGQLVRLTDSTASGTADNNTGTIVANNLPPALTDLSVQGNYVFVTGSGTQGVAPSITVLQFGATPSSQMTVLSSLSFNFAANWEHKTYALATRPTPGSPGSIDIFFNVGSQDDHDTTPVNLTTGITSSDGRFSGAAKPDSIYKITMSPSKHGLRYSNLSQVAYGLRNAAGITFQAGTGDLYFEDNGINGGSTGSDNPQLGADTLHKISAAQIGVGTIPDFGFAHEYTVQATGQVVGSGAVGALTAFLPINGSISEGPQHIAFSPASFPDGLNNGVWAGNYGLANYSGDGLVNTQNPVDFYNATSSSNSQIISNDVAALGHPVGFLTTGDSVFMADLAPTNEFGPAHSGIIYQIKGNPSAYNISGTTYTDNNHNGVFDSGDTVAKYQTVYIDENGDGVFDAGDRSTVSNRHGAYSFALPAGRYVVSQVLTSGTVFSSASVGIVRLGGKHASSVKGINFGTTAAPLG